MNHSIKSESSKHKQNQLNGFSQLTRISSESISIAHKKNKKILHRVASLISNKLNSHAFISPLVFFVGCDLECSPIKLPTLWQVSISASGSWCTKIMNQLLPLSMIQRYDNWGLSLFAWETLKPRGSDRRLQQKGKLMQKEVTVYFPCRLLPIQTKHY